MIGARKKAKNENKISKEVCVFKFNLIYLRLKLSKAMGEKIFQTMKDEEKDKAKKCPNFLSPANSNI